MIEPTKIYYFIFGLLTIAGGVMGYVKAQSAISLIAGSICGALLLVAGYLLPSRLVPGLVIGLVVSVALAGQFLPAYLSKKTFMPHGMMAILSVIGIVLTILAWVRK